MDAFTSQPDPNDGAFEPPLEGPLSFAELQRMLNRWLVQRGVVPVVEPLTCSMAVAETLSGITKPRLYNAWRAGHLVLLKHGPDTLVSYPSLKALVGRLPRAVPGRSSIMDDAPA